MNRREFLRNAGLLATGATVTPKDWLGALSAPAKVAAPLVGAIDPRYVVKPEQLWQWEKFMVGLGRRISGDPGHLAYLTFLEDECQRAGLTTFHDPTQYYPRWDADYRKCRLALVDGGGSTNLEVMSYFPGSGNTSVLPGGAVTAPIVDVGQGLPTDFAAAAGRLKGAIAFCTEPVVPATEALGYPNYYNNDPGMTMSPITPWKKWSLSILAPQSVTAPTLAQQAGCVGMIMSLEATRKCALGQYISFLLTQVQGDQAHGAPGMPILHVDYQTGRYLKSRLQQNPEINARMVLPSKTYPNTGTDEIVAFLPGADGDPKDPSKGENVVISSHTDGPSAAEENGPLGMLAIAKYFSKIPRSRRRRTLVFVFATGHFTDAYTQDTMWFTSHHPEIIANTAATLTMEHLGQKSFTDDPVANRYTNDGLYEMVISYVSQHPIFIQSVIANYQAENLTRAPVVNGPGFGVSQAFFNSRLPSYGFVTAPQSLYQMDPKTGLEGTDPRRMHHEVRVFTRMLASWENLSKEELGAGVAV